MTEKISKHKFVSLTYTITDEDENILESNDLPIRYVQGSNSQVIEKIEHALEGHQAGDLVSVTLNPEEGFGEYQPELTFSDDIDNVPDQFRTIGAEIEFQNDHGESKIFRVTEVTDDTLTVDGNHPFAGKIITYHITIDEVRDATASELKPDNNDTTSLH